MKKKIICTIIVILVLISFALTVSIQWLFNTFGHLSMEEIVFHLKFPMDGANTDIVFKYIWQSIPIIIVSTVVVSALLIYPIIKNIKIRKIKINTSEQKKTRYISLALATGVLIACIVRVINVTSIIEYIKNQNDTSQFIENEYVDAKNVNVEFPEQKRNLIYIYLESMESTYYSKENGGISNVSLIPELEKLAKENVSFSSKEKLRGAYSLFGTTWTVGAMTAQTLGIPLKIGIDQNGLADFDTFLEGAYGIGEILEKEGYHNYLMLGSDSEFGGRKNLYEHHGNYEIWDAHPALEEEKITDRVWWGFNDELLIQFAKEKITKLAEEDAPFNFTMLTADTHFENGYKCEDCEEKFDEQYKNVIACSSKKIGEFVKWIKNQSFYENTTIVISGDHLTMQPNFFESEDYDKTVVSIIINPGVQTENVKSRKYSTFDLMPTTLAALGAKIDGNKLALGVNLFSEEQTLIEKYDIDYVETELKKTSKFYNNYILSKNR